MRRSILLLLCGLAATAGLAAPAGATPYCVAEAGADPAPFPVSVACTDWPGDMRCEYREVATPAGAAWLLVCVPA
ncbi:MAG TPA: hypothetical protein VFQ85_14305 [Mycobacteriales bacterium]|jgi:hypothetical protein|nr:hypothetical protein [Mycobacteriales bacterium]